MRHIIFQLYSSCLMYLASFLGSCFDRLLQAIKTGNGNEATCMQLQSPSHPSGTVLAKTSPAEWVNLHTVSLSCIVHGSLIMLYSKEVNLPWWYWLSCDLYSNHIVSKWIIHGGHVVIMWPSLRTYELKVHGGTPFESGVEVDAAANLRGIDQHRVTAIGVYYLRD